MYIIYWDIERKRYPQYDHCAVIVAEDITSRFLNVISLFNGNIPIIAIQLNAIEIEGKVALFCTTVLDETLMGLVDEDEEVQEVTDRYYWEDRGTKETVAIADKALEMIHEFDPKLKLKYNKFYIGLEKDGSPNNFVTFKPLKNGINIEIRLKKSDELDQAIEENGLDVMEYSKRYSRYRIRLSKGDLEKHKDILFDLLERAYTNSGN